MLFQQVIKALGVTITEDAWADIGRRAMALGKSAFGAYAFEKSGHDSLRDEAREIMKSDGLVS